MHSLPTAVLFAPVVFASNALFPIAVVPSTAFTLAALCPTALQPPCEVTATKASRPTATLLLPVDQAAKAAYPTPMFEAPGPVPAHV